MLGGLLLVGVVWILVTGLLARSRLDGIQSSLRRYQSAVASGDHTEARRLGDRIVTQAGSAHQLTSGPAWWVGSHVLGLGTPLRTARVVSLGTDTLARDVVRELPGLTAVSHAGASTSHVGVGRLRSIGTRIGGIRNVVRAVSATLQDTPGSWFGPARDGRAAALAKLHSIDSDLGGAQRAVRTLVPMLGADSQQRYFVGFMNEAESRSIGGLPGAFAIVTVDDGRITIEHIGSDLELAHVSAGVDLGAEYDRLYGQDDPAGVIQNSDIGPSFPDAARIWAGMWQAKTGEHVDGAIALDPTALGYLLRATGPTRLADGMAVTSTNAAGLSESREYALYPGLGQAAKVERKKFLAGVAQAVAAKLLAGVPVQKLVAPLKEAFHERRIVVWSAVASHERAIEAAGIGGVLQPGHDAFSAFFVNNASGSKLDYYLRRSMTYRATGCGAHRSATASLTLHNDVPSYRLPAYVTYVAGGRPPGTAPGYNKLIVSYYATPGARIRSVRLDGRVQRLTAATEDSLTSVRLLIALPAHARRTLTVVTSEPRGAGPVKIVQQPLASAIDVHMSTVPCLASGVAAVPSGPASTGSPWPAVLVGLAALLLLVAIAWQVTERAARDGRARRRLDAWRARVDDRYPRGATAVVALAGAVVGLVVVSAVVAVIGKATKTSVVVRADRPVFRFFLEHRADWLTKPMAVITHIGEYQETTAIALAAALVLGVGLVRFRLVAFVVLTAVFIWPFVTFGRFYDWVDVVALVIFLALAVVRPTDRARWVGCAALMTVMPVEKHLQVALNSVVHGTVPPLTQAYAPVGPYPSGGCTRIVFVLGLVAYLFARAYRSRRATTLLTTATVAIATIEGFSRIYLGKHWFVDCLGGFVFGSALVLVYVTGLRFYLGREDSVSEGRTRETIAG